MLGGGKQLFWLVLGEQRSSGGLQRHLQLQVADILEAAGRQILLDDDQ